MRILGIIPARYASNRFPGKALVDIKGKTMVQRVFQQASQAPSLAKVVVATDHKGIFDHVVNFGGDACMTDPCHASGTDRCREALDMQEEKYDFVVNIQGDEPFIKPQQIEDLAASLKEGTQIATLAKKIEESRYLQDPNQVKVLLNNSGKAGYFSRSPLPYCRDVPVENWLEKQVYYGHLGIYAYREDILQQITLLEASPWEECEGLEQLRWLYHGFEIDVFITKYQTVGIDTPEDLQRVLKSGIV